MALAKALGSKLKDAALDEGNRYKWIIGSIIERAGTPRLVLLAVVLIPLAPFALVWSAVAIVLSKFWEWWHFGPSQKILGFVRWTTDVNPPLRLAGLAVTTKTPSFEEINNAWDEAVSRR